MNNFAQKIAAKGLMPMLDWGFTDVAGIIMDIDLASGPVNFPDVDPKILFSGSTGKGSVIFQFPTLQEVENTYAMQARFPEVPGSKYLRSIALGVVKAVTCDNHFYGIVANRAVKLALVSMETINVTIGTQNEYNYGELVKKSLRTAWS